MKQANQEFELLDSLDPLEWVLLTVAFAGWCLTCIPYLMTEGRVAGGTLEHLGAWLLALSAASFALWRVAKFFRGDGGVESYRSYRGHDDL